MFIQHARILLHHKPDIMDYLNAAAAKNGTFHGGNQHQVLLLLASCFLQQNRIKPVSSIPAMQLN